MIETKKPYKNRLKVLFFCRIPIRPIAKPRARFDPRSNHMYSTLEQKKNEKFIATFVKKEMLKQGLQMYSDTPLWLRLDFFFKNKKKQGLKITRPDLSNLIKQVEDSLNGVLYEDDNLIAKLSSSQCYSDRDEIILCAEEVDPGVEL